MHGGSVRVVGVGAGFPVTRVLWITFRADTGTGRLSNVQHRGISARGSTRARFVDRVWLVARRDARELLAATAWHVFAWRGCGLGWDNFIACRAIRERDGDSECVALAGSNIPTSRLDSNLVAARDRKTTRMVHI